LRNSRAASSTTRSTGSDRQCKRRENRPMGSPGCTNKSTSPPPCIIEARAEQPHPYPLAEIPGDGGLDESGLPGFQSHEINHTTNPRSGGNCGNGIPLRKAKRNRPAHTGAKPSPEPGCGDSDDRCSERTWTRKWARPRPQPERAAILAHPDPPPRMPRGAPARGAINATTKRPSALPQPLAPGRNQYRPEHGSEQGQIAFHAACPPSA
jgi:hypothetical protein